MSFASTRWLPAVAFLLIVPGLFWGLPSAITPQVDAPAPLGPLLFFADRNPNIDTTYPAFHQILLMPVYGIAIAFYWFTGGVSHLTSAWPYGFRDVSALFSALILLSNLVAALMGICMLYVAARLTDPHKDWIWLGILMAATNGVFVYYCRVGNLDVPYSFWWALTLFFLWRHFFHDQPFVRSLLPAAFTAACAVGSKDQAAGMAIGAGLLVLFCAPRHDPSWLGRIRSAVFFAMSAGAFYAIVAILPNPARWVNHARFVVSGHAPTPIPLSLAGEVQTFVLTVQWLFSVFSAPVLLVALAGLYYMLRAGRWKECLVLSVPLAFYYAIVIGATRVFYPRFCIPFFVPVIVFTIHGAGWIAERILATKPLRMVWIAAAVAFLVFQFGVSYVPVTYAQVFDLKRELAAELPAIVPPGSPLLISRMQSYNYPNRTVYESYKLMMLPQDPIIPPSRHTANLFLPLDTSVSYYLLGSGNAGLPWNPVGKYPPLTGELVREWRYPAWVKDRVLVPCIFEFALYRRTGSLPVAY